MTDSQAQAPSDDVTPVLPPASDSQPAAETRSSTQPAAARRGQALGIGAILLVLIASGGFYQYSEWQQQQTRDALHQLEVQQAQLAAVQTPVQAGQQQIQQAMAALEQEQRRLIERQALVEQKVLSLDARRPNDWLLAEADYLVRMAGRKLWLERDATSALMLLTNADERLRALADPGLLPLRKALTDDIARLKALPQIDREGLVLRLGALIDNVDQLQLQGINPPAAEQNGKAEPSTQLADWQDNLKKSLTNFADHFITIRRRGGETAPLISPDQTWYLKENLKTRLLQAQLAIYREQPSIYQDNLEKVSQWLEQYVDPSDSTTLYMQAELEKLHEQTIAVDYPKQFQTQSLLEDLLNQRLQRMLGGQ